MSQRILRIPRADAPGASVLLSVLRAGARPLDLRLVATEGEHPFVAQIAHGEIASLRASSSHADDAAWEAALLSVLQPQEPQQQEQQQEQQQQHQQHQQQEQHQHQHQHQHQLAGAGGLDAAATVGERELSVTLRKSISGITQRLGTIRFVQDDSEEVELFEWTAVAADAAAAARDETAALRARASAQQAAVDQLAAQLHELTLAKQAHEAALVAQFRELLNGKKVKIRDQQRLLAGAKVDPVAAAQIEHSRNAAGGTRARRPGPSRPPKRKADRSMQDAESETDPDDGADARADREDETRELATPEQTDPDETADEDEDEDGDQGESDGFDAAPPPKPPQSLAGKGNAVEGATRKPTQHATSSTQRRSPQPLPPPRALPFTRTGNAGGPAAKAVEPARHDESETDDDEL